MGPKKGSGRGSGKGKPRKPVKKEPEVVRKSPRKPKEDALPVYGFGQLKKGCKYF